MRFRYALLLLLAACKREAPAPSAAGGTPAPAVRIPGELAGDARIPEVAIKALLDEWLAAQNQGAFERYERLYAEKLQGIRRSGPRTVRLDRAGWLADRKRMFAKPMKVEIAELELARSTASARALFRQTWASDSYRDTGAKQLVIVKGPGGLRIAREEMIDSSIVGGRGKGQLSRETFLLADERTVVLHAAPAEAWGRGAIRGGEGGALRDVDVAAVPEDLRTWIGRKLRFLGAAGPVCETTITGLSLRGSVLPHFGTLQLWRGEAGEPKWSEARIAADLWEMASGDGRTLVGDNDGACAGAVWAMSADKPAPAVAAAEKPPEALAAAARAAFRALPAHREIQRLWKREVADATGVWDEHVGGASLWLFHHPRETLIVMTAGETVGCGEYTADLTAIFRVPDETSLTVTPLWSASLGELAAPVSAVDLDGDGHVELLFGPEGLRLERGLYRWNGKGYERVVLGRTPFHDCPC